MARFAPLKRRREPEAASCYVTGANGFGKSTLTNRSKSMHDEGV